MENIYTYILRIVAAALLCGISQSFSDDKKTTGAIIKIVTGLLMAVTVLSPIIELRIDDFTNYLNILQNETAAVVSDGTQVGQREQTRIITQTCEAYILDKARNLGLTVAVQVQLSDDDNSLPKSITINGAASPYAKSVLSAYITETLGIPEDKQQWH